MHKVVHHASWKRIVAAVLDPLIRRKVALHKTPLDRYQVRIARSVNEYQDAFRLVHAAYVYQGIQSVRSDDLHINPQHVLPEANVLVAYEGSELVGTMTVILDSADGLPLDKDYARELDALRAQGAKVAECSAFAVVERCWHSGVSTLLYLAATALSAQMLGASHICVGVHPRATSFYRALFNFRRLGEAKKHATLNAPVVALVQDIAATKAFGLKHYRTPMSSGRLVAEHAFGMPPPCTSLPIGMSREMYLRWKMPRQVLQVLSARRAMAGAAVKVASEVVSL